MIREEELEDQNLLKLMRDDVVGRNQQLNTFLGLLITINKNSVLTVDGGWGTGKTVFVKQIDYLGRVDIENLGRIDTSIAERFKKDYEVYYYNAWKNDYHEDPLQSLLFNLINDLWGRKEKLADKSLKFSKGFLNSVLKTTSLGLFDPEEIRNAENISELVKGINTVDERKKAIDDIINNYLGLNGKKLLFIIDELDRCKPTFAVKLLESVKHYYTNDRLVFLLSTNNEQLSHTIKKVYGTDFNGIGYLNKFYDLVFNLPRVDTKQYVKYLGSNSESGYWKDMVPAEVVAHLRLSMREVNRYYSSLNLINEYLSSTSPFADRDFNAIFVKYILVPLAYGMRVHDISEYTKLVEGKGEDIIGEFCSDSDAVRRLFARNSDDADKDPSIIAKEIYMKIVPFPRKPEHGDDYSLMEAAEDFHRVLLLINSSGNIDEEIKRHG